MQIIRQGHYDSVDGWILAHPLSSLLSVIPPCYPPLLRECIHLLPCPSRHCDDLRVLDLAEGGHVKLIKNEAGPEDAYLHPLSQLDLPPALPCNRLSMNLLLRSA